MKRHIKAVVVEAWLPIALVSAWWALSANSTSLYFPSLQRIMERFVDLWLAEPFVEHVLPSLRNLGMGLSLGLAAALVLGVMLGLLSRVAAAFNPLLEFMRSTPVLALLPLIVVFLGLGTAAKVAIIALGAFWPTFLNTIDGVRAVDPQIREVAQAFSLKYSTIIGRIVLPSATPQIMVGVRTSVSIAVVVMVGSELFGSTSGIGYFVLQSQRTYAIADMWAGLLMLGVLGYVLNLAASLVERGTLRWYRGMHHESIATPAA